MFQNTSWKNYLLYAVGEILLVMVGILLALQVNTWNENRKDRKTETKLLVELRETLLINADRLGSDLDKERECERAIDILLDHIDHRRAYHDFTTSPFHYPTIVIHTTEGMRFFSYVCR